MTPTLLTPFYDQKARGKRRSRFLYISHSLVDAATDNPTITASYNTDPGSETYTAITPALTETTGMVRSRLPISVSSLGFAAKLVMTNASSDSRIYALETDGHPNEGSAL